MKTFVIALVLIAAGFGIWALVADKTGTDIVAVNESATPVPTDYVDYSTPTPIADVAVVATSAPTPNAAVTARPRTPTPTPAGQGGEAPRPVRVPVFANVAATNGSGESGVVAVTANANDLAVVSFNLVGSPAGVRQPTAIINGTCSNMGSVVYWLSSLINGSSSTTLNVNFLDIAQSENKLAVVVYAPEGMSQMPYACAQLR